MVLSQKTQYAVRAIFELAKRDGLGPVAAARVAESQCIPLRFLENILGELRQAGIVESVRGKAGGYRLNRTPQQITVGEVIGLIQGPVSAVECAGGSTCPLRPGCVLLPLWDRAHRAMTDIFDGTSFRDLVEQEQVASDFQPIDYVI